MLIKPLHIGTIRGQQLRFYRTPNDDGRPDMPWHCHDDLPPGWLLLPLAFGRCLGVQ
jgi:hypothetical protein